LAYRVQYSFLLDSEEVDAPRIMKRKMKKLADMAVTLGSPAMPEDRVRVLRVLEYTGPRRAVEDLVSRSIHGERMYGFPPISIRAATLGSYPEILGTKPVAKPGDEFGLCLRRHGLWPLVSYLFRMGEELEKK